MTGQLDDEFDAGADEAIRACLDLKPSRSFFLYAGAGSGKTRSLVRAIAHACGEHRRQFSIRGQQIGVITYTNAACDEIKRRLDFDPLVDVRTIHSFAWSLIEGYDTDIRKWVAANLAGEIAQLEEAQTKGRPGTKTALGRERSIMAKRKRLASLGGIQRFIYSPTGDNRSRDALNHSEVIAMTAEFLRGKPALQRLLVGHYPVLLIDESQDTNAALVDAILHVQSEHREFCVGLFGDTMQRIYPEGKDRLGQAIPEDWARPEKKMNHRCPQRVIQLINKIRAYDDGQQQRGRADKPEGYARLFVVPEDTPDKFTVEAKIGVRMAEVSGDKGWNPGEGSVKTLTLEHRMAARRYGFDDLFGALYPVDRLRSGLLDGSLPGLRLFTREVLPVVKAMEAGDRFRTAAIVRASSPLLGQERLEAAGEDQLGLLRSARSATDTLFALFQDDRDPTLGEVLNNVADSGLFAIPEVLHPFAHAQTAATESADVDGKAGEVEDENDEFVAWERALATSFGQMEKYDEYVRGLSPFDTHQGVKGREFPRVMVIISDEEARGFWLRRTASRHSATNSIPCIRTARGGGNGRCSRTG